MHVIDHAIQIPVTPANMWTLVSNPDNNPKWQADCRSIAYLNSIRRGIGMRWRYQTASGKDQIAEITAWYEGLGFEYTIVDGAQFASNKGRLRLQEVPEGTIVQWTFSYELRGPLAGLRNAISVRRHLDNMIVESLRNLFRVARDQFKEASITEAKSLMQDAPSVLERATYKPRHPSVLEEGKPRPSPVTPSSKEIPPVPAPATSDAIFQRPASYAPVIAEPPIADEDTRPNPVLAQSAPTFSTSPSLEMPTFSRINIAPTADAEAEPSSEVAATSSPILNAPSSPIEDSPPVILAEESKPVTPLADATQLRKEDATPILAPLPEAKPAAAQPSLASEPPLRVGDSSRLDKRDTATISVFELFGLPRPSMTQEMAAVKAPSEPLHQVSDTTSAEPAPLSPPSPATEEKVAEPASITEMPVLTPEVVTSAAQTTPPQMLDPSDEPVTATQAPTSVDMPLGQPVELTGFVSFDVGLADPAPTVPLPLPSDWAAPAASVTDTPSSPRIGLRLRLRRQRIKVRTKS